MNIEYIVPELHRYGGIQEFAKIISLELNKYYNIRLINWENNLYYTFVKLLKFSQVKISRLYRFNFHPFRFFRLIKKNYTKLTRVDLIHFWHPEPAIAFLDIDCDYIVSCHGMEILPANIRGLREILYSEVFDRALLIHVNSNYTRKLITKLFDVSRRKIKVINPPIDYKKFASQNRRKDKDKIIIGTLTRLVKRKNVPNIIKALNILKNKHDLDFIYYLAGDGVEKKRILNELKNSKFEWKYFGQISEEKKIKEFYPLLDIFVLLPLELPNDVEGFGMVYLEANACGVPVVASKTGGIPDAVKERISGVFANPTDPEDIADKILFIVNTLEKWEQKCKKHAKNFDVSIISNQFRKIYK